MSHCQELKDKCEQQASNISRLREMLKECKPYLVRWVHAGETETCELWDKIKSEVGDER